MLMNLNDHDPVSTSLITASSRGSKSHPQPSQRNLIDITHFPSPTLSIPELPSPTHSIPDDGGSDVAGCPDLRLLEKRLGEGSVLALLNDVKPAFWDGVGGTLEVGESVAGDDFAALLGLQTGCAPPPTFEKCVGPWGLGRQTIIESMVVASQEMPVVEMEPPPPPPPFETLTVTKNEETGLFHCPFPDCDYEGASRRYNLKIHYGTHGGEASKRFCCDVCGRRFARRHDLDRHGVFVHRLAVREALENGGPRTFRRTTLERMRRGGIRKGCQPRVL
ncbi:hypothetical protein HDU67_000190 [Dinochytrium kinnereticum]|nr:hypothetical protein HDU67_000190 [Dinochytrium kinnereticum]